MTVKENVLIFFEKITGIPRAIVNETFIWSEHLALSKSDFGIVRDDIFEEYGIKVPYKILEEGSVSTISAYIEKNIPF